MRIGKQFIRNFIINQLKAFNNYYGIDRIDVIVRGKIIGYACKSYYEGIYFMMKEDGDTARDVRSACQKLRAWVREWVRNVTEAIYARGFEYIDHGCYGDIQLLSKALDEELSGYHKAQHDGKRFEYILMNELISLNAGKLVNGTLIWSK